MTFNKFHCCYFHLIHKMFSDHFQIILYEPLGFNISGSLTFYNDKNI